MPTAWVSAYAQMLSRLQAEEALREATANAVGSGAMKTHDSRSIIRSWQRDARRGTGGGDPQVNSAGAYRPRSETEKHSMLERVGIGVKIVGAPTKEAPQI